MDRSRFAHLLLIPLLLIVFSPLADGLVHAGNHGERHPHGESHSASIAEPTTHGDCESWQAKAKQHNEHRERQFEPVVALHHGDHLAVCSSCSQLAPVVLAGFGDDHRFSQSTAVGPERNLALTHRLRSLARPRAPPQA